MYSVFAGAGRAATGAGGSTAGAAAGQHEPAEPSASSSLLLSPAPRAGGQGGGFSGDEQVSTTPYKSLAGDSASDDPLLPASGSAAHGRRGAPLLPPGADGDLSNFPATAEL